MKVFWSILIGFTLTACAVSYSFQGGTVSGETFAVKTFNLGNRLTLVNPNLPIVLQEALQQKFINESNLKFTDAKADVNFDGTIVKYTITPVQGTGDQTVNLNRLTISIEVLYTNEVDKTIPTEGKVISVSSYDDFASTDDFSTKEAELVESISEKLVSLVYNEVLVNW
tara:strand:- start:1297 stop:1803 length:507 start_codon:yes stop_codon:yes gene_type:complete